jgi:hypothetical protein
MFNTHPTAYCQHKQGYTSTLVASSARSQVSIEAQPGFITSTISKKCWQATQQIQQPAQPASKHKLEQAGAVAILLL